MLVVLIIILYFLVKPILYYPNLPYPLYNDYNIDYNVYDVKDPKISIDKPIQTRGRIIDKRFIPNTTRQDYRRRERPRLPGRLRGSRSYRTSREIQTFQRPYDLNITPNIYEHYDNVIKRNPFSDIAESYNLLNYHRLLRECQSDCLKSCLHECRVECHRSQMSKCIDDKRFKKFNVRYTSMDEYPGRKFKI